MFPSKIVQIHRDRVKPGHEPTYRAVEEEAARMCVEHGCPHPHLAIESLAGPTEVWWLNAFESEADRQRVVDAYRGNAALTAALADIRTRRQGLLDMDVDVFAQFKPELSRGQQWQIAGSRFIRVTMTTDDDLPPGTVFEDASGTRYVFTPMASGEVVSAAASPPDEHTIVFAVRPYWGMPAREWIAADAEFWRPSPVASLK